MPKVSKESASQVEVVEGLVEDRSENLDGYTVGFTSFLSDMDHEGLFKGLPDDRCQCPHWGYMIKGKMTFRFADREETYEAGDAFYVPPGHIPVMYAGNEFVEFSPADELAKTMEVVMRNMAASEQA
jgi:glyoxylate utilization-related uncharacterized protein